MVDNGCVMVTGGGGYIGRHVCMALQQAKIPFVIVDNFSTSSIHSVRNDFTIVEADIGDYDSIRYVCSRWKITSCFHLAGLSIVPESIANPELYRRENVEASTILIYALNEMGVKDIVFSSSSAVYGDPVYLPIDEEHPLNPVSPYGLTKAVIENTLKVSGMRVACLRYFNACGGALGEFHQPETHLIPLVIGKLIAGEPIEIFGSSYPTRDGTAIRDFVNVADIAAAHLSALDFLRHPGSPGFNTWNLGSASDHTVLEVVNKIVKLGAYAQPEIVFKPPRPGDPPMLMSNISRAYRDLKWWPTKTLDESILEALALFDV